MLPTETASSYQGIREMTRNRLGAAVPQLGDPVKGAATVISLVESGDGPLQELLSSDSYVYATAKVKALTEDIDADSEHAHSTGPSQA